MRPFRLATAALLLTLASWPTAQAAVTHIDFVKPEAYTDVSLSGSGTESIRTHIVTALGEYLQHLGETLLPSGQTLEVQIFDIDMAGAYEPWRAPFLNNTRIMRDVYRPRFDLGFRLLDDQGGVVQEGREATADLNYLLLTGASNRRCYLRKVGRGFCVRSGAGPRRPATIGVCCRYVQPRRHPYHRAYRHPTRQGCAYLQTPGPRSTLGNAQGAGAKLAKSEALPGRSADSLRTELLSPMALFRACVGCRAGRALETPHAALERISGWVTHQHPSHLLDVPAR